MDVPALLHGLARLAGALWPQLFAGGGSASPTQVALSGPWIPQGRWKVCRSGGGKFGTPECRDSTKSHGEVLAADKIGTAPWGC